MRFMGLWRPGRNANRSEKGMQDMQQLVDEWTKSGKLVSTGGWQPDGPSTLIRNTASGNISITDGPYTEAKEMIGGYAILEAKSLEEAIELTKRFVALAGEGVCEVRALGWQPPK